MNIWKKKKKRLLKENQQQFPQLTTAGRNFENGLILNLKQDTIPRLKNNYYHSLKPSGRNVRTLVET